MGAYKSSVAVLWMLACLALLGAASSALAGGSQASEGVEVAAAPDGGLRLSGIVAVGGEPRLAVIEAEGRGARVVRPGDRLRAGQRVVELGPDWVRLELNGEERTLVVSSSPAGLAPESGPQANDPAPGAVTSAQAPELYGPVAVDVELKEIIEEVSANESADTEDLVFAVGAYFGLPLDTEISITDVNFVALENAGAVQRVLDESGIVRLRLSDAQGEQMLYLKAEDEADSAEGVEQQP